MVKDIYYLNTSVRLELATGQIVYAQVGFHENTNNVDATIKQITDGKVKVLGFGPFRKERCGKSYPVSAHEEIKVCGIRFKKNTIKSISVFPPEGEVSTLCLHYINDKNLMDSCSIGINFDGEHLKEIFNKLNIKR